MNATYYMKIRIKKLKMYRPANPRFALRIAAKPHGASAYRRLAALYKSIQSIVMKFARVLSYFIFVINLYICDYKQV